MKWRVKRGSGEGCGRVVDCADLVERSGSAKVEPTIAFAYWSFTGAVLCCAVQGGP